MPNRLIKESIRISEKINKLSDFHFRLWAYLITYVDDYGRGDARPAIIKGQCFPLRERVTIKDIDNGLHVLADTGCIHLYDVDGESYLCFPNWDKHQTVRNQKSKFPAPESIGKQLKTIESNCNQLQSTASKCSRNPNPNPNPNPESNKNEDEEEIYSITTKTRVRVRDSWLKYFGWNANPAMLDRLTALLEVNPISDSILDECIRRAARRNANDPLAYCEALILEEAQREVRNGTRS